MYRTVLLAIIIVASISNCCTETSGKDNITFADAPYTVAVIPGSEAAFNATLKNAGIRICRRECDCAVGARLDTGKRHKYGG